MPRVEPPPAGHAQTPHSLARAIASRLSSEHTLTWLDPCVGTGSLVRGVLDTTSEAAVTAIDLLQDNSFEIGVGAPVQFQWGTDFVAWAQETEASFDRIVVNPPYVPISKLPTALKETALRSRGPFGLSIDGTANYWYAFVLACLNVLKHGGSMALILPAAWEYADYAAKARELLPSQFGRFEVHRSKRPLFEDVQDGCVVVICEGYTQPHQTTMRRVYESIDSLNTGLQTPMKTDDIGVERLPAPGSTLEHKGTVSMSEIATIGIGAVTGDADFFLLRETERIDRKLPFDSVRPVLSKARHLQSAEIDLSCWVTLWETNQRVWMFDPPDSVLENSAVKAYLELPADQGGCNMDAGKVDGREPWYRVAVPRQFDGFLSGMATEMPWIALNCMPRLAITNTLYGIRFHKELSRDALAAWALAFLTTDTRSAIDLRRRLYPQGLLKLEPRDLESVRIVVPQKTVGAREAYRRAVALLLEGNAGEAGRLADAWIIEGKEEDERHGTGL